MLRGGQLEPNSEPKPAHVRRTAPPSAAGEPLRENRTTARVRSNDSADPGGWPEGPLTTARLRWCSRTSRGRMIKSPITGVRDLCVGLQFYRSGGRI